MGDYKWAIQNLPSDQIEEAVYNQLVKTLPKADRDILEAIKRYNETIDNHQKMIGELQKRCNHPLSFREHHNMGNGVDYYVTQHRCHICDLYWKTNQRWDLVGDKRGMPDDPEART